MNTDLAITKYEFDLLYPDRPDVWELLTTRPKTKQELLEKYLPSKLWRLNNLYTIVDKEGSAIPFKMNRAQFLVHAELRIHSRMCILKSRQQGISTFWLMFFFDDSLVIKNLGSGLMAQDKDAAKVLLERIKFTWEELQKSDPWFVQFLGRKLVKDNSDEFAFNNGSRLFVRTSFRSTTLQRLHVSELGKVANKFPEKAKETSTGTLQAIAPGNPTIIESTAEGNNMFKKMWDKAQGLKESFLISDPELADVPLFQRLWNPEYRRYINSSYAGKEFAPVFLSWLFDRDCIEFVDKMPTVDNVNYFMQVEKETGIIITTEQRNFWLAQESELEGDIHQEYPATPQEAFAAAKDGTFWARRYLERVIRPGNKRRNLYDPMLPVYLSCDIGRRDYMVLCAFQCWRETTGLWSIRIIGELCESGEYIGEYANYIHDELIEKLGWNVEILALPWDAGVVDASSKGGHTREELINAEGFNDTMVLDKGSKMADIENVRRWLPYMYIDETCTYLDSCFLNYSKEFDDVLKVWKNENKRDQYAHGADAIRYMIQYFVDYIYDGSHDSNEDDSDFNSQADKIAL